MIRRLYIHNFRCLENFDLPVAGYSSALLIGKNGVGKSTIGLALEVLQKIARGTNRVGELLKPQDRARGRTDAPMRFEIEIDLSGKTYSYGIAFEFPPGFKELRVLDEKLSVGGVAVYSREVAKVHLARAGNEREADFSVDWHLVALPVIQQQSDDNPIYILRQWLASMLILRPMPALITGDSSEDTLQPNPEVTNFGDWFSGLLAYAPSAYTRIDEYLRQVMPDLRDIRNPVAARESRSLIVQFANEQGSLNLPFHVLSDGEKCFMICALVLASNNAQGPMFCFWDEPGNHLDISEVGHFVLALRKAFQAGGQFIATSHNSEAIRSFSDENTFFLTRKSHLEPTIVRRLDELPISGDIVSALIRDDVEPLV